MNNIETMKLALKALEFATAQIYNEDNDDIIADAITAIRQAIDHVPDTTKMIEPEELVCVCGAIWQGQEMICPPRCLEEGIERERPTDRGAWDDVPDATKWVDELRGDEPWDTTDMAHRTGGLSMGKTKNDI